METEQTQETTTLLTLTQLADAVLVPRHSLYRWATYGFKVSGQIFKIRSTWKGNAMMIAKEWYDSWNIAVNKAREERREQACARYEERCRSNQPVGRPRREDPNEVEREVDAAEERLRKMGC